MKKFIKSFLSISITSYILIGSYIYFNQDKLLYFPTPKAQNTYKEKIFINQNESIYATLINEGKEKVIIYLGGNAEDVDTNYHKFSKAFKQHTIYLVQYRGYANSTGTPIEKNLYADALFIYDAIKDKYKDISVIGRSLGTGVATYLASKREVNKLVLVTPYDSIESIAQSRYFYYPISILLRDKYDSISRIDAIKAPTLIIYAQNDETIRKKHTDKLVSQFPSSQISIKTIENTGHSSILESPKYYTLIKEFLNY